MTPYRRRTARLLPAAIALAFVAAACAPSQEDPTVPCPGEAPASPPAQPWNDDPELAGRIPTEIDGQTVEVQTVCATTVGGSGLTTSPEFLEEVGVDLQDVTIAQTPSALVEQNGFGITAWRYAGADEEDVRAALLATFDRAGIPVEDDTVAGRPVHRALLHVYHVADDTLYAVIGPDTGIEAVVEALP